MKLVLANGEKLVDRWAWVCKHCGEAGESDVDPRGWYHTPCDAKGAIVSRKLP